MTRRADPDRGSSFVELLAALSIVGTALLVMLQQLTISYRENDMGQDKIFAYEKALNMLAELQTSVDRGDIRDGLALDAMADLVDNPVLTTRTMAGTPLPPDHPMSGNTEQGSQWRWYRRVFVQPGPGSEQMRYVRLQIQKRERDGRLATIATVGGNVNLPVSPAPAVKEYDVYLLAIAAAPSLWRPMSYLRSSIAAASDEITARNPGLHLRLHWITELGYGRDTLYTPYVNRVEAADQNAPWVYWYPGRLGQGAASGTLFNSEFFGGHVRSELGFHNGYDESTNPLPHAVADQLNHAMRYPMARRLFDQRVAAGLADPDEPPLQLLLQDMHSAPARFENAIVVNLHGEGLPFPPMRNYSDAAKDPVGHADVRVVTHPARLRPARDPDRDGDHADTEDLELRVYAYKTDPDAGPAVLETPITVQILGVDLTGNVNGGAPSLPTTLEIRRLPGGVDPESGSTTSGERSYAAFDSESGLPPVHPVGEPYEMKYEFGYVAAPVAYTWIRLYDTPLEAPWVGFRGLHPAARLYGMEYVPSPVASGGGFPFDLADPGFGPKNTARWRIRIPKAVFDPTFPGGPWIDADTMVTVLTRIGQDLGTGVTWPEKHQPLNLSETYAWWASSKDAVPLVERYQFLGDPRHNPYADLVAGGSSFPHGYNWFFDDLSAPSFNAQPFWPCLDGTRLADGFGPGVLADVPRMTETWRAALQSASAVFTNAGGSLAGTVLLGGEIALPPAPGEALDPMPVPVDGRFYGQGGLAFVDSISPEHLAGPWPAPLGSLAGTDRIGAAVVRRNGSSFWVMEWLGELAPDSSYDQYATDGNLPCGTSSGTFCRAVRSTALLAHLPPGTGFTEPSGARLGESGPASLLQIGSATSAFAHAEGPAGGVVALTEDGRDILAAAGFGMPDVSPGRVPFGLAQSLAAPLPQSSHPTLFPDHFAQLLQTLATGPVPFTGAGVIRLLAPTGTDRAFFVVLAHTPETAAEHDQLARAALLFALRGFHVAGEPAFDNGFDELPRVLFTSPPGDAELSDPTSVMLRWRASFHRFDGARYTDNYPIDFGGSESQLAYVVLYSQDGGESWRHVVDDSPAVPGRKPDNPTLLQIDAGPGDESYLMLLPAAQFPAGEYRFRVECHHRVRALHYGRHEVTVQVER